MSEIQYQQEQANYIYYCLYNQGSNRYLLADEVGLGKTVTAARVITKLAEANAGKTINVGYICHNQALAKQNIKKLRDRIEEAGCDIEIEKKEADRLTLGFLSFGNDNSTDKKTKIVIYVLTPSTTIMVTSTGLSEERQYAYWLLVGCGNNDSIVNNECDKLLYEACKNKIKNEDGYDKGLKKAFNKINGIKNALKNKGENNFFEEFKKEISNEWNKNKDKIIDECIENSLQHIDLEDEHIYAYKTYLILKDASRYHLHEYSPDTLEKLRKIRGISDNISDENKVEIENEIKELTPDRFKNCIIPGVNSQKDFEIIKDELEKQKKKKVLWQYYNVLKDEFLNEEWSRETIEGLMNRIGKDNNNNSNIDELFETDEETKEIIRNIVRDTCAVEYIKLARKCMVVASLGSMNIDLFIADEIQNYSELFKTIKNNGSEMGLVVERLIHDNHKLLLMSATPFRYHSHLNKLENVDKEKDSDDNYDIEDSSKDEDNYNNNESGNMSQKYLEDETDIYNEFKMIVEYLNRGDFNDWEKKWEYEIKLKNNLINGMGADSLEESREDYKKIVKNQSQMLLDSNISRVERYMSNIHNDFKSANITVPVDKIYFKELATIPKASLSDYLEDEKVLTFIIRYNKEYYGCEELDNGKYKFWRVNIEELDDEDDDRVWGVLQYTTDETDEEVFYEYEEVFNEEKINDLLYELNNQINNIRISLDYIKSTPAIFSFTNGYIRIDNKTDNNNIIKAERVRSYKPIFAQEKFDDEDGLIYNSRIAALFNVLFEKEKLHELLFIPPVITKEGRRLQGVFEGKWGSSKRLFFSDYQMTPKSLSVLITYEAERRAKMAFERRFTNWKYINYVPGGKDKIHLEALLIFSGSSEIEGEFDPNIKCFVDEAGLSKTLFEYDKDNYDPDGEDNYGSPYNYAVKRKELFNDIDEIKKFCIAYFKYLSKKSNLLVALAYSSCETPDSIYQAIIQYGKDGCIWDVFDEYSEYIEIEDWNNDSFAQAFENVLDISPNKLNIDRCINDSYISLKMNTDFAFGHYAGDKLPNCTSAKTLERKIQRFNSPFRPFNFISTSIGQEGFDFHVYCRKIVHWTLEYNPIKFEQREGRVNRYQSYSNRLKLARLMNTEEDYKCEYCGWKKSFEAIGENHNDIKKSSKGLFPNYALPYVEEEKEAYIGLEREGYYYPGSIEESKLDDVLKTVGYYRSLLGQSGGDTFEEKFLEFTVGVSLEELTQYFINLYPPESGA